MRGSGTRARANGEGGSRAGTRRRRRRAALEVSEGCARSGDRGRSVASGTPGRGGWLGGEAPGRGARAGAAGPARGVSRAAQARLVRLSWKQAALGGPGAVSGGGSRRPAAGGEGGLARGFQEVTCGHRPLRPSESSPPNCGVPRACLSGGPLGEGCLQVGTEHRGPSPSSPGSGRQPPPPPPTPTAYSGFPVHTVARSPLLCQLKALSPGYFCTISSPSTK